MERETLIRVLSVALSLIIFLVGILIWVAPCMTISILMIFLIVLFFILTEGWFTHNASEFENRFWSFIACLLSSSLLFSSDSPFNIGHRFPLLSSIIVFIFTYLVHNYDRHLRRIVLSRIPDLRRNQSINLYGQDRVVAQQKVAMLDERIRKIDPQWMSTAFYLPFPIMKIENDIITLFNDASTYELNYIIKEKALGIIFYKIKDHRFFNVYHRTKILRLLAFERIKELNIYSRALLLHGLQQMKLSAHELSEECVKNVIINTNGDDLSTLKSLMDSKEDFNSMHKLVYVDIRTNSIKNDILKHIASVASIQDAHMTIGSKAGKRRKQYAWRKILSDVDDTLSCSGGSFPAGIDTSYPPKSIYPGVLSFYRELDLGTAGINDEWDPTERIGNLVFLSARPHVYKDLSENHSYSKFKKLRACHRLHTPPSLLAGSLDSGKQFLFEGSFEPLARKKYENFVEYLALYPEYKCLFIGDNGQGDVRASELLREHKKYSNNLERVYIHEVQQLGLTHVQDQLTRSRDCPWICYFKTYIDAAIDAWKNKLIRASGLRRIVVDALQDFIMISEDSWKNVPPVFGGYKARDVRLYELREAAERANRVLVKAGQPIVKLPSLPCRFPRGTPVQTPYGRGVVVRYRPQNEIYDILALWDASGSEQPVHLYLNGKYLAKVTSWGHDEKIISPVCVVNCGGCYSTVCTKKGGGASSTSSYHHTQDKLHHQLLPTSLVGSLCWTPYGLARLINQRNDSMVLLQLLWGTCLLNPVDVIIFAFPRTAPLRAPASRGLSFRVVPSPSTSVTASPASKGSLNIKGGIITTNSTASATTPTTNTTRSTISGSSVNSQHLHGQSQSQGGRPRSDSKTDGWLFFPSPPITATLTSNPTVRYPPPVKGTSSTTTTTTSNNSNPYPIWTSWSWPANHTNTQNHSHRLTPLTSSTATTVINPTPSTIVNTTDNNNTTTTATNTTTTTTTTAATTTTTTYGETSLKLPIQLATMSNITTTQGSNTSTNNNNSVRIQRERSDSDMPVFVTGQIVIIPPFGECIFDRKQSTIHSNRIHGNSLEVLELHKQMGGSGGSKDLVMRLYVPLPLSLTDRLNSSSNST